MFSLSMKGISQNSFGAEYGIIEQNHYGFNLLDSIIVRGKSRASTNHLFGFFYEVRLLDRISIHNKLNYFQSSLDYSLYNENRLNPFDPVIKSGGLDVHRFSLQVLPQLNLARLGSFRFNLFGGLNVSADFTELKESDFVELPRVEEVYSSLETSHIPISLSMAYGGSIEYSDRLVIWAKMQPDSYYSREINVNGTNYSFENRWWFYTLSIGYKFYSFQTKNTLK